MEDHISEEAIYLKERISNVDIDSPYDITDVIMMATCNIICAVVKGQRYDYDDPEFKECLDMSRNLMKLIGTNNPVFVFRLLKYIPGDLFGYQKVND